MANKDPIGERMWGQANPDGMHSYGSDAHLAAMREQARQDEARNFRASGGGRGGAGRSRGGFGSLLVLAIVGFFIWNGVKNNAAPPAHTTPAVQLVARTPPLAMRNSAAPDVDLRPVPAMTNAERRASFIAFVRGNQTQWEQYMGEERVRRIKATLPAGSMDEDYLTALDRAYTHVMSQIAHRRLWEHQVGAQRLTDLQHGLPSGASGLDYLDRLEQAAGASTATVPKLGIGP